MSLVELFLYATAFVVGATIIPIIAYGGGSALPGVIGEPIANMLFMLGMLGTGPAVLEQAETEEYHIKPVGDDVIEPKSYWSKWSLVRFGISYEPTREAFGTLHEDVDPEGMVAEQQFSGEKAEADVRRGDTPWYVDLRELRNAGEDRIVIPIGEKLSELRGSAGIDVGAESVAEALKEHGGDTSSYSPKIALAGMTIFASMGLGMGYVVFM